MIFFYITCSLVFIISGILGLTMANGMIQILVFLLFIAIGFSLLIYTLYHYRKKKDKSSPFDWIDCINCMDCSPLGHTKKGMDCDCTPDCIN